MIFVFDILDKSAEPHFIFARKLRLVDLEFCECLG